MTDAPCPKCGYTRQAHDTAPDGECPRCGIVFAKFLAAQEARQLQPVSVVEEIGDAPDNPWYGALWQTAAGEDPIVLWGRIAAWLGLALWAAWFIHLDWQDERLGQSFMHLANLPYHEFGHVLFRPFGTFKMFLVGSLFQLLWPMILGGLFIWRYHNPFGGAVCLAWAGQSLKELAPYIGDARALDLPLIMEYSEDIVEMRAERHDWHNILEMLGWLPYDLRLARFASFMGSTLMLLALSWGTFLLYRQWQARRADA